MHNNAQTKPTAHNDDQRPEEVRAERTQEDPSIHPSLTIFAFIWPRSDHCCYCVWHVLSPGNRTRSVIASACGSQYLQSFSSFKFFVLNLSMAGRLLRMWMPCQTERAAIGYLELSTPYQVVNRWFRSRKTVPCGRGIGILHHIIAFAALGRPG